MQEEMISRLHEKADEWADQAIEGAKNEDALRAEVERLTLALHASEAAHSAKNQIDKLADFIMNEVDGEPSQNEGAGDCAARIIRELRAEVERLKQKLKTSGDPLPYLSSGEW